MFDFHSVLEFLLDARRSSSPLPDLHYLLCFSFFLLIFTDFTFKCVGDSLKLHIFGDSAERVSGLIL